MRGWLAALAVAVLWGLGPALPAWLQGELIGSPWTDLYPSVWGLWAFASDQPGWPTTTTQLAAPEGMPFYYSSPLHGWLAAPLLPWLGIVHTWNLSVVAARVATVLCAFGAARAWGLKGPGALFAATAYACSPFFHGYAVEGIVEGLDGWTLACFLWAFKARRSGWAIVAFGLTLLSSWYLGAVACFIALFLGPRAWALAIGGLLVALPGLTGFLGFADGVGPLDPAIRRAMGTQIGPWRPGVLPGENPFAMTSWVGLLLPVLAAFQARRWPKIAAAAGVFFLLSFGWGPWFELPPLSAIRFPYRFHAGTLLCLALLAGAQVQRWSWGWFLTPLLLLESLLLSPIEPLLPAAPSTLEPVYADLSGQVLLDIPGPLSMPPGQMNRSRPRARWFLYQQVGHGMGSPWVPDFNSVSQGGDDGLDSVRALDPLAQQPLPEALHIPASVDIIVLHPRELSGRAQDARAHLSEAGWRKHRSSSDGAHEVWLPATN